VGVGVPLGWNIVLVQAVKAAQHKNIAIKGIRMRGAGEKSEKANLVVMINRERESNGNGYSNEVNVLVDKNTMGATGTFQQMMQPKFFRVGDFQIDAPGIPDHWQK